MNRVLIAGATGYLGGYIAKELVRLSYPVRALVRNPEKLKQNKIEVTEIVQSEITRPDSIKDCCKNIDVVISTVGITRQKEGLTYMDVDYQANMNLLQEAKKHGVKKFIYISVLNGENLRDLKICEAKELFVKQLIESGLDYCIIRPNGFFSDMTEFYKMATKGRVYLFGDGELKTNPIHGEDLAAVCIEAIQKPDREIKVGGPETLSHNEIATVAFDTLGIKPKITHIPNWVRVVTLKIVRLFTGSKVYGPIEFFMTVMAMDMVAPEYGRHTLREYFTNLNQVNR
ncbi:MAG: SDR family oxidoreductase [Candidatus Thiodiazotropha lotti]|nr:SDR family oxidoreductase [Candidatus Thiodiazotropha lotti]MCG7998122.1 SDR family oxidoreductase [Candidatus Thiodiazotropha lotti]MCW4185023.1 SDR family oxidoreductase [Candidatus Thiodiazotropha weberae]MCW4189887.1 SDR family oxidoreductase [Candidatus Thiodiazotropha weberae]